LRSWFQRQQTCPTCRLNILRAPITSSQPPPQPQQQQNQQTNNSNNQNQNARPNGAVNQPNQAGPPFNNPFLNLLAQTGMPPPPMAPGTSASTATATGQNVNPQIPPFMFPTIPFVAPYSVPPPPPPPNLDRLTDEELRAMEGHERKNVEERIKVKNNIETLRFSSKFKFLAVA
jgi:E3 ubiquitin-protein ligase synoviolin